MTEQDQNFPKHSFADELAGCYETTLEDFLENIVPKECWNCKSTEMAFWDYTDEEALWRCKKCNRLTPRPFDFRDPNGKIHFYMV